jgi:GT2 family glycosyltransferase
MSEPGATPSVSVVLVNLDGAEHLPACLDSLAELDYPHDRYDVLVVDNGSTDGSVKLLSERYPAVRVLAQGRNLGFAEGNNVGARASTADCLALLNTDMAVDPAWLTELVAAYAPDEGYRCVAGVILDWSGERLDFADGAVNYYGMGAQIGFDRPLEDVAIPESRDLLFACGGAMLVERETYLGLGGFDPEYFAYFEDVDFGWRLWLAGHKVRLASRARVRHRHHGTSGGLPSHQRRLLYERNALRTLMKNLEDRNLWPLLSAALLLLGERARILMESRRDDYELFSSTGGKDEKVLREGVAAVHAVSDLVHDLEPLMDRRAEVQALRRRGDDEIFELFRRPFLPAGSSGASFVEAMATVTQTLRLDALFERRRATRVVVLAYDTIGPRMAGPGARCWEITRALGRHVSVTLASPGAVELKAPGVEVARFRSDEELRRLVDEADVLLVHGHAVEQHPFLATAAAVTVVDLYDPWLFENLEHQRQHPPADAAWMLARDVDVQGELLDVGDFFVCASERQRDYWLGMLSARGRLDRDIYRIDPTLRQLIDIVPYGCPGERPPTIEPVLKGVHPKIPDDAFLIVWGGGTWEWFDPLSLLEAFAAVIQEEPRGRLYFMGLELPNRGVPPQRVARELKQRAEELGLAGESVIFGDWVPYEERGAHLLEADVGVMVARPLAESRLAFRSRLLDHFWTGLPTITTRGDELSELVEAEGAGVALEPGDVDALRDTLLRLIRDPELRAAMAERAASLAERYRWPDVIGPIVAVCEEPWRWTSLRRRRRGRVSLTEDAQIVLARRRFARPRRRRRHEDWTGDDLSRPVVVRVARQIWWRVPEGLRARVRPALRRVQARRAA